MRNRVGLLAVALTFTIGTQAFALDEFNLTNSALPDEQVSDLLRTVAIGADHRAYMPASSIGLLGFDLGLDVTAISVPTDFVTAMSAASGSDASAIPGTIPVPKLSFHKGLPGGVDFGFSYATSKLAGAADGLFSMWGLDLKYSILSGLGPLPAVAVRFNMSSSDLWFLSTNTYALDAIVSKNLYLIDPYAGAGLKYWSGELKVPVELAGASTTLSSSHSSMNPHIFVGIPLKLMFLRITAEADYNLAGITTYGAKVSLGF
ncbi:MAG: hypothetical protein A2X94_07445 [Bdellovibrionales bacterium GWB1_55_8]|nr:MAG: hypothetical protein A2X94_07445 [Bdellovibrionales bacterium GWB1_55_8]